MLAKDAVHILQESCLLSNQRLHSMAMFHICQLITGLHCSSEAQNRANFKFSSDSAYNIVMWPNFVIMHRNCRYNSQYILSSGVWPLLECIKVYFKLVRG
jgi:hypothetical protein